MTIVITVLLGLLVIATSLRWRKLRRDALRRRWVTPIDSDPRENAPRIRIVSEHHVPRDQREPVVRPVLDSDRQYVFGENHDVAPLGLSASQQRDRALERAGRRRRRFRSSRRRS